MGTRATGTQVQQPSDEDTGAAEVQYAADRDDEVITATIPKKSLPLTGGMQLAGFALIGFGSFVAGVSVFRFGAGRNPEAKEEPEVWT